MGWFNRSKPDEHAQAIETAWRIHGALSDWTGKVDAKASFAFAIESAGIATVVALSGEGKIFEVLQDCWQNYLYYGGLIALAIASFFAVWVVIPRLRMRHVKKEYKDHFIYFGHLKYWDAAQLPKAIEERDLLPVLSQQMVKMSDIAWRKHIAVKISMFVAMAGGAALAVCAVLIRF
ncbi:hypothetical protein CQ017_03955 [Arthrobacter sp. MYb224]|uniref:Pycsar system effector family protein n=1 Tax=Arthrobacter sp. MYb224 TaxID=1848600 RepID=UPI000CFB4367|nr:Pycsar system effector family protein [Arthrobacter sp. MYb224]PRA00194.1 hypothetical protein CQ017_03955 [Arthrobacter sp. MYb224]